MSTPIAKMPTWLFELLLKDEEPPRRESGNGGGEKIPEGARNNTLASLAGTMRRKGMSQEAIEVALLADNKRCDPPIADSEVLKIARSISRYDPGPDSKTGHNSTSGDWTLADRLFPRIPFPWEALPEEISASLQQLGRACATSPNALPGAAFSLLASVMGRARAVSPKMKWEAPLIFWNLDLRESGEGKTPAPRLMAGPIHAAQRKEESRYEAELEKFNHLTPKERQQQQPPLPAQGFFVSDLTLEGLRDDLANSSHGGIVVIQDEISAFIAGQNQYKSRGGTDRESWLALFDGHPARVKRVGKTTYLDGARVSIFGGIQPQVFRTFFAGANGLYLTDGTLFRFLITFEPSTHHELTSEAWEEIHRKAWEDLLLRAIDWTEQEICARGGKIETPVSMLLSDIAQKRFLDWRNDLNLLKDRTPPQLRGFLPKAFEYCLRLTGIVHCLHMFSQGLTPLRVLDLEDLERGISLVHFYLGQTRDALRLIEQEDYTPVEISERTLLLAQTLEKLRPHVDNGRLAIGFVREEFNKVAPPTQAIKEPRSLGVLLRVAKLTTTPGRHHANGRVGVFCLEWDSHVEKFLSLHIPSQPPQPPRAHEWQGPEAVDIKKSTSTTSTSGSPSPGQSVEVVDMKNSPSRRENSTNTDPMEVVEVVDVVSKTEQKLEFDI